MVAQFQSSLMPLIDMAPIPLMLIGILPGHRIGIIVRNSIFLVAFISIQPQNDVPLSEAITRAGAIRPRPILLTAAALREGAFVIVLDPIFAGLAVTGAGRATLLTLVVIPVLYYTLVGKRRAMPPSPEKNSTINLSTGNRNGAQSATEK